MDLILEVLSPDFLLRNSVWLGIVIGVGCPLVGVYLLLRRMVFLGVALPQISSCGIACAFALHTWGLIPHMEHGEQGLALTGSAIFSLGALGGLSIVQRRGRVLTEGHLGMAYVLAAAWSISLLVKNPHGEHGLLERLRGDIVTVTTGDLLTTTLALLVVVVLLVLYHKELLLVAYDREMAITMHKVPAGWDLLLFLLVGVTVSLSVYGVGPLVTFGFLLMPPLIAHRLARGMPGFAVLACVIGAVSSFVGFCIAYKWDLPVGATDVAVLGVFYLLASVFRRLCRKRRSSALFGGVSGP
jgi:ABC-type Mn2+/Zn2+ transport system permease subunit